MYQNQNNRQETEQTFHFVRDTPPAQVHSHQLPTHTHSVPEHMRPQQAQGAGVTPISTLKAAMAPEIVELSGFSPEEPVHFRLRRANLGYLLATGQIPNALLAKAKAMYTGPGAKQTVDVLEQREVMLQVVKSAMVAPTYEELEEAGVVLMEQQILEIWGYAQKGIAGVLSFRPQRGNAVDSENGGNVENTAK